jgi:hypothetical protein
VLERSTAILQICELGKIEKQFYRVVNYGRSRRNFTGLRIRKDLVAVEYKPTVCYFLTIHLYIQ